MIICDGLLLSLEPNQAMHHIALIAYLNLTKKERKNTFKLKIKAWTWFHFSHC